MIKVIKILQGHKVTPKKQRMQMKAQKHQSTAHNSKNDTWTIAEYDKSDQNTAGTQTDTTSPRAIRLKPPACNIEYRLFTVKLHDLSILTMHMQNYAWYNKPASC